jgi:hypothetical protein
MDRHITRHALRRAAIAVSAGATILGLSACGSSDVTKARLERNLPQTFANLYVQQAKILGHKNITVQSLQARASCDKGGPKVADHGPGADWICQMNWKDPNVVLPDGYGKFEVSAHSNDCYTAGGPSKLIGLQTITDTHGNDVNNPVFEFDSCFNPRGSNAPTGVAFATPTATVSATPPPPTRPAALTLPAAKLTLDSHHEIAPQLRCSTGDAGCAGTITATRGGRTLGSATYALAPGGKTALRLRLAARASSLVLTVKPVIGTAQRTATTVTLPKR